MCQERYHCRVCQLDPVLHPLTDRSQLLVDGRNASKRPTLRSLENEAGKHFDLHRGIWRVLPYSNSSCRTINPKAISIFRLSDDLKEPLHFREKFNCFVRRTGILPVLNPLSWRLRSPRGYYIRHYRGSPYGCPSSVWAHPNIFASAVQNNRRKDSKELLDVVDKKSCSLASICPSASGGI